MVDKSYVDFAPHMTEPPALSPQDDRELRNRMMLARVLNMGTTVAFIGAGMSSAYGLPGWAGLARTLLEKTIAEIGDPRRRPDDVAKALPFVEIYLQRVLDSQSRPSAPPPGAPPGSSSCDEIDRRLASETLLFFIGECQKVYDRLYPHRPGEVSKFHQVIAELIGEATKTALEKKTDRASKFRARVALDPTTPPPADPLKDLLSLPIQRIVTSNYDLLLEHALAEHRGIPLPDTNRTGEVVRPPRPALARSFTQDDGWSEELALFSLVRVPDADYNVFHCHGSVLEPDSIVASERDYQRWYLNADERGSSYLQTLQLLFGSNPILFIGLSLNDGDLLRQLRVFVAGQPRDETTRPIFALLRGHPTSHTGPVCERKRLEIKEEAALLEARYGVHSIFCPWDEDEERANPGITLQNMIRSTHAWWREWWMKWQMKPHFRKVDVFPNSREPVPGGTPPDEKHAYYHYRMEMSTVLPPITPALNDQIDKIARLVTESRVRAGINRRIASWTPGRLQPLSPFKMPTNVIVILGASGSGKSWSTHQIIEEIRRRRHGSLGHIGPRFDKTFYWSSYYANDALTGIDRAIKYIDPDGSESEPRLDRLRRSLKEHRFLLVFDGFERMLRRTDDPEVGTLYTQSAQQFLQVLTEEATRSVIILVSQLWPSELGTQAAPLPNVAVERLDALCAEDVRWSDRVPASIHNALRRVCSLLEGHMFGVVLARAMLDGAVGDGAESTAERVIFSLSSHGPNRRPVEMVRIAIEEADRELGVPGLALALLERVAAFMSPVVDSVWEICYEQAEAVVTNRRGDPISSSASATPGPLPPWPSSLTESRAKDILVGRALAHRVQTRLRVHGGQATRAISVHPMLRNHIHRTVHRSVYADHPHFSLPGYSARTPGLDPGSDEAVEMLDGMLRALEDRERRLADEAKSLDDVSDPGGVRRRDFGIQRRTLARGAYSLVRARMELNTAARWTHYADYVGRIARLANLVKRVTHPEAFWSASNSRTTLSLEQCESDASPLYADELAWLYNELGLALYAEGSMLDAIAVWEQSAEVNRLIETGAGGGVYRFQSALNLGAAYIQLGRLAVAETLLDEAQGIAARRDDDDSDGRVKGYLGILDHLRGDLKRAWDRYTEAIDKLNKAGNRRAESLFLKHRSDVRINLRQFDEAERDAERSRALAEAGVFPDLVAASRQSLGHVYRIHNRRHDEARREYMAALELSQHIGAKRLQSEVHSELSRLALAVGDAESARQQAMEALRIANRYALGLRQSHALVVLGRATIETGNRPLGVAYLKHAHRLTQRQQYWLRFHEAEEQLAREGEAPRQQQ